MSLDDFRPAFLTIEPHGQAYVARCTRAHLSEEENIEQMAQELVTLIDHYQCNQLALCLELVEFITSAALGKLIMIHRKLHRKEGRFVVCGVQASVADVLRTSRLDQYFTIATDTQGALLLLTAG